MIRPLTIATCLLACGSGLYLYESKHEVQLLDRTIERTVHETNALREQSRLLAAEWTMLNDPERLRRFSDAYLTLKTITPSQFTSLADLDSRLPEPQAEVQPHSGDEQEPAPVAVETISQNTPGSVTAPTAAATAVADEELPVPPIPAIPQAPAAVSAVRSADTKTPDHAPTTRTMVVENQARPAPVADARPSDQRPSEQRSAEQRSAEQRVTSRVALADAHGSDQHAPEQRAVPRIADARKDTRVQVPPPPRSIVLAAPRPLPANASISQAPPLAPFRTEVVAESAPYGGSLLGMARSSMPPAPRPIPTNAAYSSN
jgi:hypothetical protein